MMLNVRRLAGFMTLALALAEAGCTLKPNDSSTLTIVLPDQLPQSRSALAAFSGLQSANLSTPLLPWSPNAIAAQASSAPVPTLAGYTCFGVNVSGPGIFADPRMSCGPSGNAGVMGGLVPVMNGAQISVNVPSGPSRTIQLFATTSTVGCPDINTILNQMAANGGQVIGVNQPFLIAQTTVDVYSDTDVTLDARGYNPSTTVAMFNGCGGGGTVVPLTSATKGYLSGAAPTSSFTQTAIFATAGELTLTGATPLTAAELSLVSSLKPDNGTGLPAFSTANSMVYSSAGSASVGNRAVAQFVWDVSNVNIAQVPVMQIDMQIGGGGTPNAAPSPMAIQAGALVNTSTLATQNWDTSSLLSTYPGGQNFSTNLGWASLYRVPTPLVVPCSLVGGTGTSCVVVNVDSNILSSLSTTPSVVAVGGAQLTLYQTPPPLGLDVWPRSTTYYANSSNGSGGTGFNFHPRGGIPPYTMAMDGVSYPAPNPSVSPSPNPTPAPSSIPGSGNVMWSTNVVGAHTVTVTDSSVPAHSYSFPFATVGGLSYPAWTRTTSCMSPGGLTTVPTVTPVIGGTNILSYAFSTVGMLPPGTLSINPTTGAISGTVGCNLTPTTFIYFITATDSTGAQIQASINMTY